MLKDENQTWKALKSDVPTPGNVITSKTDGGNKLTLTDGDDPKLFEAAGSS